MREIDRHNAQCLHFCGTCSGHLELQFRSSGLTVVRFSKPLALAPERKCDQKPDKPLELCDTLQPRGWGCIKADDGKHKDADQMMGMLAKARGFPANLLPNTGPLPDGSIHDDDALTLRITGRRLRAQGWPAPAEDGCAKARQ